MAEYLAADAATFTKRDLVDDEGTRANRQSGTETGFIAAMLAGIACYFIAMFEPVTANEAGSLATAGWSARGWRRARTLHRRWFL